MQKKRFKDWFIATRPWSFPASIMPIIVTVAYLRWRGYVDFDTFYWGRAGIAFLSMLLFHTAGNLMSDYMDYRKGVDRKGIVCVQTLVSGAFVEQEIGYFGLVTLSIAMLLGIGLVYFCGWPLLLIGGIGVLTTCFYSFFKYHALGDAIIFCNFSLLPILGMPLVFVGKFVPDALILALPIGLITVAILHINNTRDILPDSEAGIRTFGMLLGRRTSIYLYLFEILLPYIFIFIGIGVGRLPFSSIIVLISLPISIGNVKSALCGLHQETAIAGLDERTAQLQLMFSLLLTIGFIVGMFWK